MYDKKLLEIFIKNSPHLRGKNLAKLEEEFWYSQHHKSAKSKEIEIKWQSHLVRGMRTDFKHIGTRNKIKEPLIAEEIQRLNLFMSLYIYFLDGVVDFYSESKKVLELKKVIFYLGFKKYKMHREWALNNTVLVKYKYEIFKLFFVLGVIKVNLVDSEQDEIIIFPNSVDKAMYFYSISQIESTYKRLGLNYKKKDFLFFIKQFNYDFFDYDNAIHFRRHNNIRGIAFSRLH